MSNYETIYTILGLLILCVTILICIYKKKYHKLKKKSYTSRLMSTSSINNDLSIEKAKIILLTNHKLLL